MFVRKLFNGGERNERLSVRAAHSHVRDNESFSLCNLSLYNVPVDVFSLHVYSFAFTVFTHNIPNLQ